MTLALVFLLAVVFACAVFLAASGASVRRERDDALALISETLDTLAKSMSENLAAQLRAQAAYTDGLADAARELATARGWRVVVTSGRRTVFASPPMPYHTALVIAGRASVEGAAGTTVEVVSE